MAHVLIVGASLGGLRAAEALRNLGFGGAITLVGAEAHLPYNRPPLSKEVLLGDAVPAALLDDLLFQRKPNLNDVTWRLGIPVSAVDLAMGEARLADGGVIAFDAVIAASGLQPRRLPLPGAEMDRFVLRTFDDALALRARLRPGQRVAIIGGGFIGCELASSALARGCIVHVIEPLALPMQRALGPDLGAALLALHESAGIGFLPGRHVATIETDGMNRLRGLVLDDGARLAADLVVEAIGSIPNTAWLEGNGLDLSDGILCDDRLAATGSARLAAVGDVARFPNPLFDVVPRRIEHWSVPGLTARRAAEHIVRQLDGAAPEKPFAPMPTFWSDQLGLRIQSVGMPGLADRIDRMEGALDIAGLRRTGAVMGYWRGSRQVGMVAVGIAPQRFAILQQQFLKVLQFVIA